MDDIYTLKKDKKTKKVRFTKPMLVIIITLLILIISKKDPDLKSKIKNYVYDSNITFTKINEIYQKYAGEVLPGLTNQTKPVFNETLDYTESVKYLDGTKLTIKSNLIPALDSGLVVFIGEKEGYNQTVIIQQVNGVDLMYGNLGTISVKLYDYVEKGTLIGEAKEDNLFLVYKKEGQTLNYEEYIKN